RGTVTMRDFRFSPTSVVRYILLGANILVWGGLVWMGVRAIRSVEAQHVPGYPNAGQIDYYVAFPVVMLVIATAPTLLFLIKRWAQLATAWPAFTLFAALLYRIPHTGGV